MNRGLISHLLLLTTMVANVLAETNTIDLKALAKRIHPAVMLLVVSDETGKPIAEATGFLVSSDGKLVTNRHVVDGAADVIAQTVGGKEFPVLGVLAYDDEQDLVLLRVETHELPFLTLGNSQGLAPQQRVAIVGAPLKGKEMQTVGSVSIVHEWSSYGWMEIHANLWEGSSGSPVLEANGDVIGVMAGLGATTNRSVFGMAIPVEAVKGLLAKCENGAPPTAISSLSKWDDPLCWMIPEVRAAASAYASGNHTKALEKLDEVLTRLPQNARMHLSRGIVCVRAKSYAEAVLECETATRLSPNMAEAWGTLGMAYFAQSKWSEAIPALHRAAQLKPGLVHVWRTLGSCYDKEGKFPEEIAAYQQALKIKPDEADTWILLAETLDQQGKKDAAIDAYRQALKAKTRFAAGVWYSLGIIYIECEKYEDAMPAFQQSTILKPDFPPAWYGLGIAYGRLSQQDKAQNVVIELRKLNPKMADELAKELQKRSH